MHDKLTDDELSTLQDFLDTPGLSETSMDVVIMEGYFAALAIGPRTVMPSQWLPWVWDMEEGEASPPFADADQANAMFQRVLRQYNGVVSDFMQAPEAFRPIYEDDSYNSPSAWCHGFMLAVQLGAEDWAPLLTSQPAWIAPFTRLGTPEGLAETSKQDDAESWIAQILPSVEKMRTFWLAQRHAVPEGSDEDVYDFRAQSDKPHTRSAPKVGRNDPCPCGGGKKFKKCCAVAGHTLH